MFALQYILLHTLLIEKALKTLHNTKDALSLNVLLTFGHLNLKSKIDDMVENKQIK